MYAIVVMLMMGWFGLLVAHLGGQNLTIAGAYQQQVQVMNLRATALGVQRYIEEVGQPPASLDALVASPSFSYLRGNRDSRQTYALSGPLTDGMWTYRRTVLASVDLRRSTQAGFLTANACGVGPALTADSWCGQVEQGTWWRHEDRTDAANQLLDGRIRLNRQLQVFADYFSANQNFPAKDALGAALAVGSVTSLTDLVGFTGTAADCTGMFVWQGIPIGCEGLFDRWGGPVSYAYLSPTHMTLVAYSPVRDNTGTAIVVAADFDRDTTP